MVPGYYVWIPKWCTRTSYPQHSRQPVQCRVYQRYDRAGLCSKWIDPHRWRRGVFFIEDCIPSCKTFAGRHAAAASRPASTLVMVLCLQLCLGMVSVALQADSNPDDTSDRACWTASYLFQGEGYLRPSNCKQATSTLLCLDTVCGAWWNLGIKGSDCAMHFTDRQERCDPQGGNETRWRSECLLHRCALVYHFLWASHKGFEPIPYIFGGVWTEIHEIRESRNWAKHDVI